MNREQFQRAAAVFEQAIGLEGTARVALVERACGDDAELRAEVESLLARHRPGEPGRLEAAHRFLREDPGPPAAALPEAIGRYQVRRVIGAGAMGTVYEAVQDDPHRVVALKVLRHGVTSPSMLRRFRQEARFLGLLQHPNIAQIYDAATHDDGAGAQPYFAMEYVEGRTLTDHARASRLGVRERVELLAKVCDAVQHAHGRGIIHRDLKPGNILVDERGEPRVLDFGVARATDADLRVTTLETGVGVLVGTLPYMSPEQVAGDGEPDARSDVYALGVILYELLAGRLPHDLRGKSIPEAARIIQSDEPSSLGTVSRTFRGDLETIVARALEKDPARRYPSAADLAADLRHFLREEPIVARPASTLYQLQKFARRHPALVGGVAASFLLLVAGIVGVWWQLQATRDQVAKFQELNDFVMTTFALLSPAETADVLEPPSATGRLPAVETLLVDAAQRLETGFERWPETRADLHLRLGLTFWGIGLFEEARGQLDHAISVRREHLGDEHLDTYAARLWRCQIGTRTGEPVLEHAREAREVADGLQRLADAPLRDVLAARLVAAEGQLAIGDADAAVREELEVLVAARDELPDDALVFDVVVALAFAYASTGRHSEAVTLLVPTLEQARQKLDERDIRRRTLAVGLAGSLNNQKRYAEALEVAQEAVRLGRIHAPPSLTVFDMRATNYLADALFNLDRAGEAEAVLLQRADECREHLDAHAYTLWAIERVGNALVRQERYQEAVDKMSEALAKALEDDDLAGDAHVAVLCAQIARAHGALDHASEARKHWRLAIDTIDLQGQMNLVLLYRRELALLLESQDRFEEAEQVWRERVDKVAESAGDRRWAGLVQKDLATFLFDHGDLQEAEALAEEAAENLRATLGPAHRETVRARRLHAMVLHRLGRSEEAAHDLLLAVQDAEREHGAEHGTTCWLQVTRGRCLTEMTLFLEAEEALLAGYACRKAAHDPGNHNIDAARKALVALYEAWGRPEEAARWREE